LIGLAFGPSVYRSAVMSPPRTFAIAIATFEAVCIGTCMASRELRALVDNEGPYAVLLGVAPLKD